AKASNQGKLQTQRAGNPIFDVIVELDHVVRGRCRIIWDVAKAADNVLEGNGYSFETRRWDASTQGVQVTYLQQISRILRRYISSGRGTERGPSRGVPVAGGRGVEDRNVEQTLHYYAERLGVDVSGAILPTSKTLLIVTPPKTLSYPTSVNTCRPPHPTPLQQQHNASRCSGQE
ncbi:hypothetical protein PC116_g27093, partial [Phytophthora cactorum]